MSKLEDSCVSLGTAKRLVEVGIVVDSYWYYVDLVFRGESCGSLIKREDQLWEYRQMKGYIESKIEPAPTFVELLGKLPAGYHLLVETDAVELWRDLGSGDAKLIIDTFESITPQDKLAEILIKLKKEG